MKQKTIAPNVGVIDAVGIDVAKSSLSICLHFQDGKEKVFSISNTSSDISLFVKKYLIGCKGKIVMESTGFYHWLIAIMLSEAALDVRVVNPIATRKYTTSAIRKVKTDPVDAHVLAQMALIEPSLPTTFAIPRDSLILRKKFTLAASLKKEVTTIRMMLSNHSEAVKKLKGKMTKIEQSFLNTVDELDEQIVKLEKEIVAITMADEEEKKRVILLATIPGVSVFGACVFSHWFTQSKNDGVTKKSYIAYAGLDVTVRESGSWHGKGKLTKRGNSALRTRLYHSAWGAVLHNEIFKAHYTYLRETCRRSYTESLTMIGRKLATIIYAVLRDQKPYDPTKIFFQTQLLDTK